MSDNYESLCKLFEENLIDFNSIGFCDTSAFLKAEKQDPSFLRNYCEFVKLRPRSNEYDIRALKIVPAICDILYGELVKEGRLGACVDLSMVLQRILEAEGIWSYCVSGALHIKFSVKEKLEDAFFYAFDMQDIVGHAWVCAPPYGVIDLTVKQQQYFDPEAKKFIPQSNLFLNSKLIEPDATEICSPEVRAFFRRKKILIGKAIEQQFDFLNFKKKFPSISETIDGVEFRYIPVGVNLSELPLKEITNQKWSGRYGYELYEDLVRPQLRQIETR